MKNLCVCYTINEKYFLPTLLSAIQVTERINITDEEVVIICFGASGTAARIFADVCTTAGIRFVSAGVGQLQGLSPYYARFFIDRVLEREYKRLIYLDGDTQILGSLSELINACEKQDKLIAVRDPMCIDIARNRRRGKTRNQYLKSIGIRVGKVPGYFNSGMLATGMEVWNDISKECLRVIAADKLKLRFPDQDVLNLVVKDNYCPASFKWNCPSFFENVGLLNLIKPRVMHYMSNPRPWEGAFLPWGEPGHEAYRSLANLYPGLEKNFQPHTGLIRIKYDLQQKYKRLIEHRQWNNEETFAIVAEMESLTNL